MNLSFSALVGAAAILSVAATPVSAQVRIGVVLSTSGASASLGLPQRNSIALLPKDIGGQAIEYILLDDGSDSARAVASFSKLIDENKVDAVIGSSTTPASLAMIPVAADKHVPMISLASSSRVILPMDDQRRWVFKSSQSDNLMADAIAEHMFRTGVKTAGFVGFDDALGEGWLAESRRAMETWGIQLVAVEKFSRSATDAASQAAKLMAAKPDAVLVGGSGTPAVLPQKALRERGYAGKVYQTHGVAIMSFIRAGGKDVEGAILPAGPMLVASQLPDENTTKGFAGDYVQKYEAAYGAGSASPLGAYVYDAGIMLHAAIPVALMTAKPGTPEFRSALRDGLESAYGLVLTNGVSEMTSEDHNGFDKRARVMVTVQSGSWKYLPQKGR